MKQCYSAWYHEERRHKWKNMFSWEKIKTIGTLTVWFSENWRTCSPRRAVSPTHRHAVHKCTQYEYTCICQNVHHRMNIFWYFLAAFCRFAWIPMCCVKHKLYNDDSAVELVASGLPTKTCWRSGIGIWSTSLHNLCAHAPACPRACVRSSLLPTPHP